MSGNQLYKVKVKVKVSMGQAEWDVAELYFLKRCCYNPDKAGRRGGIQLQSICGGQGKLDAFVSQRKCSPGSEETAFTTTPVMYNQ